MAEQVGRVLGGRYRLRALVGTGASAQVYLADDITLERRVAVKVLHPSLADDPGFLKRFRAEARAAAALNHPNIMAVYDWGEEPEPGTPGRTQPYLVCEFLGGGSLRSMLDRGRLLSPSQALVVGLECARGLDYAHRRGFVHRDIKPANLLFGEDGRLRIADFGLARALAEAAWTEPAGVVMGTARYASPEQARGQAVDGRTDVYSLALVLVEAITGQVPFAADTVTATLMARIDKLLPVTAELGPLAPVLERAGRPDPAERFDAGELAKALVLTAERLPRPQPLPLVPSLPTVPGEPTVLAAGGPPPGPPAGVGAAEPAATGAVATVATVVADRVSDVGEAGTPPAPRAAPPSAPGGDRPVVVPAGGAPAEAGQHRRRWPLLVVALAVLAAALGGGAWWFTLDRTPEYLVPDLTVGITAEQAVNQVADFGWVITTSTTRVDGTTVGQVVAQDPLPSTMLRRGGTLVLTVSIGQTLSRVPSLVGLTQAEAEAQLATAGLTVGQVTPRNDEEAPAGQVLEQQFPPATEIEKATPVDLVVSAGPAPRTVPDVVGKPFAEAEAALTAVQLGVQRNDVFSDSVPAGVVVATEPGASATLNRGDVVRVDVSKGPDLVTVPDVTGRSLDEAVAILRSSGLVEGQVSGRAGRKVAVTDPRAGTNVRRGSRVDLVLG